MQNELLTNREQVLSLVGKVTRFVYGIHDNVGLITNIHPHRSHSATVKVDLIRPDGSTSTGFNIVGGSYPVYATTYEE